MIRVAFQGERGAYSEAAAAAYFSETIETVPFPTFYDILESTKDGKTNYAILPVENSLEGSVGESYDLLLTTELSAVGEIYHRIIHCLIGFDTFENINTVYSHPQALGQCRNFLQKHKMKTIPTYDTAGSVKILLESKNKNSACIASKRASEIYKVPLIEEGIEDDSNNYTRFLVLTKEKRIEKTEKDKTCIIFSIKHVAGALYNILAKFNESQVNMTKIESRPKKGTPWEYNFFVDFEGNNDDPKIKEMIDKIKENTLFLKILGSYPRAEII